LRITAVSSLLNTIVHYKLYTVAQHKNAVSKFEKQECPETSMVKCSSDTDAVRPRLVILVLG